MPQPQVDHNDGMHLSLHLAAHASFNTFTLVTATTSKFCTETLNNAEVTGVTMLTEEVMPEINHNSS